MTRLTLEVDCSDGACRGQLGFFKLDPETCSSIAATLRAKAQEGEG